MFSILLLIFGDICFTQILNLRTAILFFMGQGGTLTMEFGQLSGFGLFCTVLNVQASRTH